MKVPTLTQSPTTSKASSDNVVFIINSLAGGGAERVMTTLLACSRDRAPAGRLHLILLDHEPQAYAVPEFVQLHQLDTRGNLGRGLFDLLAVIRTLQPRVMLSFLTRANILAVVVGQLLRVPTIISERVDTASHLRTMRFRAAKVAMVRIVYGLADRIIAVSPGVAHSLTANFGLPPSRISVIENPVDVTAIRTHGAKPATIELPENFIVGVGRLVTNKNFSLLISAFAKSGVDGDLVILGDGPEREALVALAAHLGVADRVRLPGFVANPFAVISCAGLFVLPSNAEGFPNGLLEGMALGRPVISTNCESGPAEVLAEQPRETVKGLTQARYGVLTPTDDVDAMAEAIRGLQDPQRRRSYGELAETRARMFSPEQATDKYWALLEQSRT